MLYTLKHLKIILTQFFKDVVTQENQFVKVDFLNNEFFKHIDSWI